HDGAAPIADDDVDEDKLHGAAKHRLPGRSRRRRLLARERMAGDDGAREGYGGELCAHQNRNLIVTVADRIGFTASTCPNVGELMSVSSVVHWTVLSRLTALIWRVIARLPLSGMVRSSVPF